MVMAVVLAARQWARAAAWSRVQGAIRRNMSNTPRNGERSAGGHRPAVVSARSTSAGTVRVRRGQDPIAKEVEMDTTIARIMGSDWGDRRKQPVSLPMRIYWGIFIIVLANGAYTYITGKDETYLVEKVHDKLDEKLGTVETDEFVVMAGGDNATVTTAGHDTTATTTKVVPPQEESPHPAAGNSKASAPTSMFASSVAPTTMPYLSASAASRPRTKADFITQLQRLREQQGQLKHELVRRGGSVEALQTEIHRLDLEKARVKEIIKKL